MDYEDLFKAVMKVIIPVLILLGILVITCSGCIGYKLGKTRTTEIIKEGR
jgi:hypothetical protein